MSILDLRRTDLRTNVLENPFWITSGIIDKSADDKEALLFSFAPRREYTGIVFHSACVKTLEAFVGGTIDITVGTGTIPTEDTTNGGTLTPGDADFFFPSASQAGIATVGVNFPTTGAFVTNLAAGDHNSNYFKLVDSTVVSVYAALTSDATITAGQAVVQLLVSYIL